MDMNTTEMLVQLARENERLKLENEKLKRRIGLILRAFARLKRRAK